METSAERQNPRRVGSRPIQQDLQVRTDPRQPGQIQRLLDGSWLLGHPLLPLALDGLVDVPRARCNGGILQAGHLERSPPQDGRADVAELRRVPRADREGLPAEGVFLVGSMVVSDGVPFVTVLSTSRLRLPSRHASTAAPSLTSRTSEDGPTVAGVASLCKR